MIKILSPDLKSIKYASSILKSGSVVAMPTETVYGLAGIAFNEKALAKIFSVKERPTFDPLIVHVAPKLLTSGLSILDSLSRLKLVDSSRMNEDAKIIFEKLAAKFWPGPLTFVLPKQASVPDLCTSGLNTVAIRMPAHTIALQLIEASHAPLAAPSANRFGRISPTTAKHVASELGDRIDCVIDGGSCNVGIESTVLKIEGDGELLLLRPGGVSAEEIEDFTSQKVHTPGTVTKLASSTATSSPGVLENHYAPKKPLYLLPSPLDSSHIAENQKFLKALIDAKMIDEKTRISLLLQDADAQKNVLFEGLSHIRVGARKTLSQSGNLSENAKNLFGYMRELDADSSEVIFAEPPLSKTGLGFAIHDRLFRASVKI